MCSCIFNKKDNVHLLQETRSVRRKKKKRNLRRNEAGFEDKIHCRDGHQNIYIYIYKTNRHIYISKYEIQMISSIWMKDIVIKENESFILLFGD